MMLKSESELRTEAGAVGLCMALGILTIVLGLMTGCMRTLHRIAPIEPVEIPDDLEEPSFSSLPRPSVLDPDLKVRAYERGDCHCVPMGDASDASAWGGGADLCVCRSNSLNLRDIEPRAVRP